MCFLRHRKKKVQYIEMSRDMDEFKEAEKLSQIHYNRKIRAKSEVRGREAVPEWKLRDRYGFRGRGNEAKFRRRKNSVVHAREADSRKRHRSDMLI